MAKTAKQRPARPESTGKVIPISQPSPRMSVLWSPALLRSVLRQADSGDLSMVADLCDQIVADDRFGELLGQLADDVIGCDLTFEESLRTIVGSAEKSDELTEDWSLGYDDDELKNLLVWTLITGVGFAKHETWIETPHASPPRIVPTLKWWHPQHFKFMARNGASGFTLGGDLSNHCWHVKVAGTNQWKPIEAGDGEWVIVTRRGEYSPWRNGLWRALGVWWLLKQYAMQDSGVHSEKTSKIVVSTDKDADTTAAQRAELAQYIHEASRDAVISLPQGCSLQLVELKADLDTLYHSQIRLANESAALTILGQNLSTTVEGGSLAAAKEHSRKENRRVRNAAQMLSKNLQAQSLSWWAEFNFGDSKLAPYPRWHTEPEQDYAAKAGTLSTLATAVLTLKTAGWEISEDDIEEDYGVVLRKTKALKAREEAEPGDTDGDGVPHNEPGNVNPADDGKEPKPNEKAPKAKPPRARPKRPTPPKPPTAQISPLASGDDPQEAAGFVRGQLYTDNLTDRMTRLAAEGLAPFIDKLLAAIDGADSYENVRYRVIKTFQGQADPVKLAKLIERALLLANLNGRHAVMEDVPESADDFESLADDDLDAKYNPKQPRVPAGSPNGGKWTSGKGGGLGASPGTGGGATGTDGDPGQRPSKEQRRAEVENGLEDLKSSIKDPDTGQGRGELDSSKLMSERVALATGRAALDVPPPPKVAPIVKGASPENQRKVADWTSRWVSETTAARAENAASSVTREGSWAQYQYAATQSIIATHAPALRAAGVMDEAGYITVFRGVGGEQAKLMTRSFSNPGESVYIGVRPITSWSTNRDVASTFAGDGGVVVTQKIHSSRVFATHLGQNGRWNEWGEQEFAMLHPEGEVRVEHSP